MKRYLLLGKNVLFTLLLWGMMFMMAGCSQQKDGAADTGKALQTDKTDTSNDQGMLSEQASDEEALQFGNADADPREAETEYPIITEIDARWLDHVIESEGIYCVYVDDKYGFLTDAGEEITPFVYEEAAPFNEGLACVCVDGKYGYIDKNGNTALEFIYDYATPFVEGLAYFAIEDSYGFMDKNGEPVFYLDCDSVSSFQEGLAYFSLDGKYGYIDNTGTVAIEAVYDDADYFHGGVAKVRVGNRFGVIDTLGREVVPVVYEDVDFEEGYIIASKDGQNYLYGSDDTSAGIGGWRLLLEGESIYILSSDGRDIFRLYKNGKEYLADASGELLFESDDRYRYGVIGNMRYLVAERRDEENSYEVLDLQGNVVVPSGVYDYIKSYGFSVVMDAELIEVQKDGKSGFLDPVDMTLKIPMIYEDVGGFEDGHAWVMQDGMYGVIDREGNLIRPIEYEKVRLYENGAMALWKDGMVSLYNSQSELLYQASNCKYITLSEQCYEVELERGTGYVTLSGKPVDAKYFDYTRNVYSQPNLSIGGRYGADSNYAIVKTGPTEVSVTEIGGALLKNAITPRIPAFNQLFLERMNHRPNEEQDTWDWGIGGCSWPQFRSYAVDGCDNPILFYNEEPYSYTNFPLSSSAFYQLYNDQAVQILSGYQCGGSERGDYAVLWYDRETGQVLPGLQGGWGGFGGYASGGYIYKCDGTVFNEAASYYTVGQDFGNYYYRHEELLATPELFYDDYDVPYNSDNILDADSITEYEVDGERTTVENYQRQKDRYEILGSQWYTGWY
ncbi:MAG: WG repeat-containing protein [Lachnospiraceae bacterium]|nr:WG repeat-containing protein [Lachnospiraceae bacterium]